MPLLSNFLHMSSERQKELDAAIDKAKAEGIMTVARAAAAEENKEIPFMRSRGIACEVAREICNLVNQTQPGSRHYDAAARAAGHPNADIVARNLEWQAPDLNREQRAKRNRGMWD